MSKSDRIFPPVSPQLAALCRFLRDAARERDARGDDLWPGRELDELARRGVFAWFVPQAHGGENWSDADLARGYLALAEADLTTTFILTQWAAACRRITASENAALAARMLPALARGEHFTTVAISHLSTSRRHLGQPALVAHDDGDSWRLVGSSAWVTGAIHADSIVVGAATTDGGQLLVLAPSRGPGIALGPAAPLVALTGSCTGEVRFDNVRVPKDSVIAGPVENVMAGPRGTGTGGIQTSALALGLSRAAIAFLEEEAWKRPELAPVAGGLEASRGVLVEALVASCADSIERADRARADRVQADKVEGHPAQVPPEDDACKAGGALVMSSNDLRSRANSLVLRATQAALGAAKGAGFVRGHPAGRWCREALFFLVWSCPQPVLAANLCEWATPAPVR